MYSQHLQRQDILDMQGFNKGKRESDLLRPYEDLENTKININISFMFLQHLK